MLVLFAEALVAGAGVLGYRSASRSLEERAQSEVSGVVLETEALVRNFFQRRSEPLRIVTASPEFRRQAAVLANSPPAAPEAQAAREFLRRGLQRLTVEEPDYSAISLKLGDENVGPLVSTDAAEDRERTVPAEGALERVVSSWGAGSDPASPKVRALRLREHGPETVLELPFEAGAGGSPVLGMITARLVLDDVQGEILAGMLQRRTGDAFLFNRSGLIVTRPRFFRHGSLLKTRISTEAVRRCLRGQNGVISSEDYRGVPALIAFRWLPREGLGIVVKIDREEVLEAIHGVGWRILWATLGAGAVAGLLAGVLGRWIAGPIVRLREAAARLAAGDLGWRTFKAPFAEMRDLGREFASIATAMTEMKAGIVDSARRLEDRVGKRTEELAFINFELGHEVLGRVSVEEELRVANRWAEAAMHDLAREIDIRGRRETQLRQAKSAAEDASRAKSEFLANMSHEIRTPINGILGMTDLALDTELTPRQRDYLTLVKQSVASLLAIVNDILDFAKIEAGKLQIDCIDFSLREVLEQAAKPLALPAALKNIDTVVSVDPEVPDAIVGDPARLRQVLVNLVGNAVKFTEAGEISLLVTCEALSQSEVRLRFSVLDTGIGIPAAQREAIFTPFVQAAGGRGYRSGGTGLGLAISKRLVDGMGGSLSVESTPGEGSCFSFALAFGLGADSGWLGVPEGRQRLEGLRTLIVESNPSSQRMLETAMCAWQMQPTVVDTGEEALEQMETAARRGILFHLVVLNAALPGMDGFAVADSIARRPQLSGGRGALLMLLPPTATSEDTERAQALGAAAVVCKPVMDRELLRAVLRWTRPSANCAS